MTKKTSKVLCHFLFSGYTNTAIVWKQPFIRELTGGTHFGNVCMCVKERGNVCGFLHPAPCIDCCLFSMLKWPLIVFINCTFSNPIKGPPFSSQLIKLISLVHSVNANLWDLFRGNSVFL